MFSITANYIIINFEPFLSGVQFSPLFKHCCTQDGKFRFWRHFTWTM